MSKEEVEAEYDASLHSEPVSQKTLELEEESRRSLQAGQMKDVTLSSQGHHTDGMGQTPQQVRVAA